MQIFNYKSPWHQSKSQKFLIWLVKVFSKIRTSFSKSLKGKERLSVVFWGWVVAGNLVWVLFLTSREFDKIVSFYGLFMDPLCKYLSSYGIKVRMGCVTVSLALFLLMFISYPFLSQAMLLKASNNISNSFATKLIVKLFAIVSMIGLLVGFGIINFYALVLGSASYSSIINP